MAEGFSQVFANEYYNCLPMDFIQFMNTKLEIFSYDEKRNYLRHFKIFLWRNWNANYIYKCYKLYMTDFHVNGHRAGRDATIAAFRSRFYNSHIIVAKSWWVSLWPRLWDSYRQRDLSKPVPPFNTTMLHLFGVIEARGEVQKRVTLKIYWTLFLYLFFTSGTHWGFVWLWHQVFLLAMWRFAAIRGWPSRI